MQVQSIQNQAALESSPDLRIVRARAWRLPGSGPPLLDSQAISSAAPQEGWRFARKGGHVQKCVQRLGEQTRLVRKGSLSVCLCVCVSERVCFQMHCTCCPLRSSPGRRGGSRATYYYARALRSTSVRKVREVGHPGAARPQPGHS